jgi:divalent metal cation (Fe/Co/Zn/Cd) transporter
MPAVEEFLIPSDSGISKARPIGKAVDDYYEFQVPTGLFNKIEARFATMSTLEDSAKFATFATSASWGVNWFLFIVKIIVVILSSSKAVVAALVDSAVDLVSQGILSLAELYMSRQHPDYPVGRSRLEAISVLGCAFVMCVASIEVIQFSVVDLYNGIMGHEPVLEVGVAMYVILGIGILMKFFLYIYCQWAKRILKSDMLEALAEDHFNDVISNSVAILTAAIAFEIKKAW